MCKRWFLGTWETNLRPELVSRAIHLTGEQKFYGEYLTNAQGEDVVAGIRTPKPITGLKEEMPAAYDQLRDITSRLEKHYRDVQDFEFTIENERLVHAANANRETDGCSRRENCSGHGE